MSDIDCHTVTMGVRPSAVQLIRDVQIVKYDPFSSFPGFNKIKAYE
jgi:hypothetical protein